MMIHDVVLCYKTCCSYGYNQEVWTGFRSWTKEANNIWNLIVTLILTCKC